MHFRPSEVLTRRSSRKYAPDGGCRVCLGDVKRVSDSNALLPPAFLLART